MEHEVDAVVVRRRLRRHADRPRPLLQAGVADDEDGAGRPEGLGPGGAGEDRPHDGAAGSWLVEGIGEDFVPAELRPLAGVARPSPSPTPRASPPRASCCGKEGILAGSSTGTLIARGAALLPRADDAASASSPSSATAATSISRRCSTTTGCSTRASSSATEAAAICATSSRGATPTGRRVTVGPDDTLLTAYARMKLYDISQLPVLRERQGRGHRRRVGHAARGLRSTRTSSREQGRAAP